MRRMRVSVTHLEEAFLDDVLSATLALLEADLSHLSLIFDANRRCIRMSPNSSREWCASNQIDLPLLLICCYFV